VGSIKIEALIHQSALQTLFNVTTITSLVRDLAEMNRTPSATIGKVGYDLNQKIVFTFIDTDTTSTGSLLMSWSDSSKPDDLVSA